MDLIYLNSYVLSAVRLVYMAFTEKFPLDHLNILLNEHKQWRAIRNNGDL